jgi:hypothetical protein
MVGSAKAVQSRLSYVHPMVGKFKHDAHQRPRRKLGEALIGKDLGKAIVKLF